eukprot:TRINITY_DN442_c0_g1_i3.p1 TRINITY_DN442_c0_g1~~TRINITY_DN442_c0_g1_i3.p1  ORF type:complete len:296 (-),score=66.57 TRINITY_DN442_c0_g1_i3:1000-1812(-)
MSFPYEANRWILRRIFELRSSFPSLTTPIFESGASYQSQIEEEIAKQEASTPFSSSSTQLRPHDPAKKQILIIGGGPAGATLATHLHRRLTQNGHDIFYEMRVIESSETHFFKPKWMRMAMGSIGWFWPSWKGDYPMQKVIPKGVEWVKKKVDRIQPQQNLVYTTDGVKIKYDVLVVAAGAQVDYGRVPGLREGLKRNQIAFDEDNTEARGVVTSSSIFSAVGANWRKIKQFAAYGGTAVFTAPKQFGDNENQIWYYTQFLGFSEKEKEK